VIDEASWVGGGCCEGFLSVEVPPFGITIVRNEADKCALASLAGAVHEDDASVAEGILDRSGCPPWDDSTERAAADTDHADIFADERACWRICR
jgi:hypothetical protein